MVSDRPGAIHVKDIKRATRKHYSSEEKIRIVLDGLRGEDSIAELCRREGISQGIYYKWSKDFMEAGKRRLAGDRSSVWSKKATCRRVERWPNWASPAPHSIAGMTGIYSVVRLDCRINLPSQSMSGTAFLTKCGAR